MKIVPKQRIGYMDIAKGICIMLIVLFHIWTNSGKINTIVISFHVPLFFFISGAFFKMYDNFGIFIKKKINTILIPYIIFYLLFRFAYSIVMLNIFGQEAPNPNWNHLWLWFHGEGVGGPIWFLRCLFWINLYYYAIVSVCKNNQFAIAACSLLLGIMGFVMGYYAFALPLHLDTGMTAMPFFSAGHFLFANTELFKENKYDKYIYPLILSLCIVLYLTACGPSYLFNKFDTTIFIGCSFLKTYISGFAGVLCLMGEIV